MFNVIMVYKVTLSDGEKTKRKTLDENIGLLTACHRADLYKNRNGKCRFVVVNNDNGDWEYEA